MVREKAAADSKARAAEDVARAADLGERRRKAEAEAEIGPERTRMWLLYLAGCSLAFERGGALINQTLVSKRRKGPSGLPLTRADLYRS